MTLLMPTMCMSCIHLNKTDPGRCKAFPKGIPENIRTWGEKHTEPVEGQNNTVVWELRPGAEEQFEDWKDFATDEI